MPKTKKLRKPFHYVSHAFAQKDAEHVVPGSAVDVNASELIASYTQAQKSKLEKRKERHEKWLQKFDSSYSTHSKKKKKKSKREDEQTTNILSDFSSFKKVLATLPDMSTDPNFKPQAKQRPLPKGLNGKKIVGKKARRNAALAEMQRFHKVLTHPAFVADPLETIQVHVQNTLGLPSKKTEGESKMETA